MAYVIQWNSTIWDFHSNPWKIAFGLVFWENDTSDAFYFIRRGCHEEPQPFPPPPPNKQQSDSRRKPSYSRSEPVVDAHDPNVTVLTFTTGYEARLVLWIGALEEEDGVNEGVNNGILTNEDVETELDDDD
ncbi:hypothetical protein Tco_0968863 [Tanacetum coccineum]